MGNFQKGGDRGGRGGFRGGDRGGNGGGRGDFKKKSWGNDRGGDRDRGPITMHRAVCAECRRDCEVPFMPNGRKPVLCAGCFEGNKDGDRGGRSDFKDRGPRRDFNERPSTNSFAKPVQSTDDLKRSINELTTKVDKLVYLFEKMNNAKKEVIDLKDESTSSAKKDVIEETVKKPSLKTIIKKAVQTKVLGKKSAKKVVKKSK